jgi:hypothetical protein
VKRRKKGGIPQVAAAATTGKKVLVRAKAMPASSSNQKKVVVVKRSGSSAPAVDEWETVIEVVRPSKLERRRQREEGKPAQMGRGRNDKRRPAGSSGADNRVPKAFAPSNDSGTTFADLLAASEKRKRERDKKRK